MESPHEIASKTNYETLNNDEEAMMIIVDNTRNTKLSTGGDKNFLR